MDWLERSYDQGSSYLVWVNTDFVFENLWDEPRFHVLVEKMGLKKSM